MFWTQEVKESNENKQKTFAVLCVFLCTLQYLLFSVLQSIYYTETLISTDDTNLHT